MDSEKRSSKREERDFVEEMMYRIAAPIIVWPGYEYTIDQSMKEKTRMARLLKPQSQALECTNVEACLYLSTASLAAPMGRTWFKIYMKLFAEVFPEQAKEQLGETEKLESYEEQELHRFKQWIFKKQMEAIKDKTRQEGVKVEKIEKVPAVYESLGCGTAPPFG